MIQKTLQNAFCLFVFVCLSFCLLVGFSKHIHVVYVEHLVLFNQMLLDIKIKEQNIKTNYQQIQDHQAYMIWMLRVCDEEENPQNIV